MAETVRLYYQDVYQKEFDAEVLDCRRAKKGWEILLSQSAFYPEGGGQPCDTGSLDGIPVLDVREKEGELLHLTEAPLEKGTSVHGCIDWERRFDLMQQHSGEHMVSGLVHAWFGYDNVGFHMGTDVITIDFNGHLSEEDLSRVEEETNRRIWENKEIEISFPTADALAAIEYRSKKELTGQVRIVCFPGTDVCACCGTHVTHTGEIALVKILSVVKFHEGVRIEMVSGGRAFRYLSCVMEQNHQISTALSAKPKETAAAVLRLQEENFRLKGSLNRMEAELFEAEAEKYAGKGSVLLFKGEMEPDSVRRLADTVAAACQGCCAVFSKNPNGTYKYAIGERDGNLRQFTKEMNAALNGRGGGKPFFVQGSVKATEEEIRRFFER